MRLSFSHPLLITCFLLVVSCQTTYVPTSSNSQNIPVSNTGQEVDSQVVQLYLPFKEDLEKDMKRVISISGKEMIKKRPESYLTNFLADLLLEEAKAEAKSGNLGITPAISFFNYGGIRTFIPKGEITVGKVFELMPFENEMVYLQLTGLQVQEFLNRIAEKGGDSVGGVRFVIANNKAKNIYVGGVRLNLKGSYWLATNDYVAEGGDGMTVFTQREAMIKSGKKIRDLIIHNLEEKHEKGETLSAELDGRISYE